MAYGQFFKPGSIASGTSTSGGIDLEAMRGTVYVYVSTMSTSAALTLQDSPDGGVTYYNKFVMANSSATQANAVTIGSAVGTNGGVIRVEGGAKYLRVIASATVDGGVQFKVIGND